MPIVNPLNKIVLTGFRATGKSTLGQLVAKRLGFTFLDTDQELTKLLGATIAQIVAQHGWPYFRRAEAQLVGELSHTSSLVIATGGGAIEHQREWRCLRQESFVVWLDADTETLLQRIMADTASADQRPALLWNHSPRDEIVHLLEQRRPLYAAGSDVRFDTVPHRPEDLVPIVCAAYEDANSQEKRTTDLV